MNQAYNALMAEARRLKGACDALIEEKRRLRALNAKLVTTSESLVELVCERFTIDTAPGDQFWWRIKAIRAALAEARESQQPPHGLPSGTA
jgi:hypothetical protein